MNILFTSVGKRYYLINYFKNNLDSKIKIISVNSSNHTSAKNYSNYFYLSPKINSNSYMKFISSIIKKHKIGLVVPLIDIDCKKLSKNIKIINKLNAILIAPPFKIVDIILDKYKLYEFLKKNNLNTPRTYASKKNFLYGYNKGEIKFPVILKPRYEYFNKKNHKEKIVIQEFINGTEYGLDLLNSIKKKYHSHLLKKKIEMRNGETDICKVSSKKIIKICKKISKLILHNFIVDIDMINKNKKFYIIDINPRIGGGYPFTHIAGFDMIKYLLKQVYLKKHPLKKPSINNKSILLKDICISVID